MGADRIGLHRCEGRAWYTPSGAAVVICLHTATHPRRAARAVQGEGLSVWQVLQGTPSAPCLAAHRVARCDDHWTHNLFI